MSEIINNGIDAHSIPAPDTNYNVRETFGLDLDMEVPGFSDISEYVPTLDPDYQFNHDTNSCNFSWVCLQPACNDSRIPWNG